MGRDEHIDEVIHKLKEMLQQMKFGSITLIIQDGKVIQLEKSEKVRLK
ncbi:YezD family protein [Metabacillus arenae]|uniref:YezD family protein n=1 Tax=Metabacillus arenae TaxID=2771434 RepID=A0A926RXB9_9BACI|nr:YezD family protein [Metabacillus arenae]MBD1379967.1 YezD family protein [Metabacillus arenae]